MEVYVLTYPGQQGKCTVGYANTMDAALDIARKFYAGRYRVRNRQLKCTSLETGEVVLL